MIMCSVCFSALSVSIEGTTTPYFKGFFCQVRRQGGMAAADAVGEFLADSFVPNDQGTQLSNCQQKQTGEQISQQCHCSGFSVN